MRWVRVIGVITVIIVMTLVTLPSCAPKQRVEVVNPAGGVDTVMVRRVIRTEN